MSLDPQDPASGGFLLYCPHLSYACPMHPEVRSDQPGLCPQCGMKLLPVAEKEAAHGGHGAQGASAAPGKHEGHSLKMFARKFWISLALTIPVVLYAGALNRFGWKPPAFPGSSFLPFVFGSVVFFYGGWVFLRGAGRELRAKLPGMMTLIGIAITAAYVYSVYVTVRGSGAALYWELTTLITIMLLGHWLEMRAVQGTQSALKELSKLLPDTVEVLRGGTTAAIPLAELRRDDVFLVRPGGKVAADGTIVEGASDLDESAVTGESRPVKKGPGDAVIAGTVNGDGFLKAKAAKIEVSHIGEKTFLAGVMRLVAEALASKSRLQMLSDRAASYLTLIAVGGGAITLFAWIIPAGPAFAVERMVAVLVIACPHALGLAVPLVASISTTMAARNGFLVKQRLALESAREVGVVLFDKTGTLTKGEYGVQNVWAAGADEREVLRLAASVDAGSEHFISKAIVTEAGKRGLALSGVGSFSRVPGKGARGVVDGRSVSVGGRAMLEEFHAAVPEALSAEISREGRKGKTVIYVIADGNLAGVLALADVIREESREAIAALKKMNVRVGMITGDSEDVAAWVASDLGIDEVFARVLPGEKSAKVKLLQEKGMKVAMVGDGINDAPALTQADLGIAIGAGTNVAIESAGIILVRNDPRDIPKIISLSRLTYAKMMQNLFWATGYNVVALPLAAGVLAFRGILLQPAVAAVFMSLSTVIVAVNALLLRRRRLH